MDHFDLVISNDEADIGFYAREHNEGDAFVAWYKALEYDIAGIENSFQMQFQMQCLL